MHRVPLRRDSNAGVTLIEVLVVLVLIGVMTGVAGLSLGNDSGRGDVVGREAELLVARLNRAADETMLTGRALSFVWDHDGYRFAVRDGDAWVPHSLAILHERHLLPDAVTILQAAGAMMMADDMRPLPDAPLTLTFTGRNGRNEDVRFDGINAARIGSDR